MFSMRVEDKQSRNGVGGMKKQYWTIIQPDGKVWMNIFTLRKNAWSYIYYWRTLPYKKIKKQGYRVVKCWVEIEEVAEKGK
jgi:hypothetical protein